MRIWIDFQSQNLVLLVIVFLLSFFLAFLSYRYTLPPLSTKKKIFLLLLRWLALFCLFLAMAETLLGISRKTLEKSKIALLLDSSRSMNMNGRTLTRKDVMQEILEEEAFKDVLSNAEIYTYLFSDSLIPYKISEEFPPLEGKATSIGNVLEDLDKILKGEELSAVILISDGVNNKGKDPLDIAGNYAIPIYTLGIGEFVSFKDMSLEKIEYEEISYSGEIDSIVVTVKNQGYTGIKIPVILQEGKEVLASKELQFNFSGEVQKVKLIFESGTEGVHNYQVSIPKIEGESFLQNNLKILTRKILKKRFKVFLVTQDLNWEYTFLKRSLKENRDVTFESMVFSSSTQKTSNEFNLNRGLEEYDLLVLLDSPNFLISNQKEIGEILQDKGISLFILVGERFFRRGDLSGQLRFLPFQLSKGEKILHQNFNLRLSAEGRLHPVARLSGDYDENSSLWMNLPPFERLIPLIGKDGAKILATTKQGQRILPGIMVKELEKGKIEVLCISPLWKWDFLSWGVGKDNFAYRKFWENSFRWLLSKEDMDRFKITTDKKVYKRGEEIKFISRLLDESYQKISDAHIGVMLFPEERRKDSLYLNLFSGENGIYSYTISFLPSGKYIFKGEAKKEELILGVSQGEFRVEKTSIEDEELNPNKELLQEIAFLSGGEYSEPENFSSLLTNLELSKKSKVKIREIPLWDQPLLLLLFVLFLTLEWFFRKRFQLL